MAPEAEATVHVVMVPSPSESHVTSVWRFAEALASEDGVNVTFAYPARAHALAQAKASSALERAAVLGIRVEVLPDGMPTEPDVQPSVQQFLDSLAIMRDGLSQLLASQKLPRVEWIVSDTFVPWTQDVANEFGLGRVDFWTSTATVYAMGLYMPELLRRGHLPAPPGAEKQLVVDAPLVDFIPGLPPFPITELPHEFLYPADHPFFRFMLGAFSRGREARCVIIHSIHELERHVVDALSADGISIYTVGPLLPPPSLTTTDLNGAACLRWLDVQAPRSVVYVALGTFATLTPAETHAMALGLEASGHPFLWVIRADSVQGELSDMLPDGFLGRVGDRGRIFPWAPQPAVLSHESVAVFMSHCGWNSTLESLWAGVPVVACPRVAEQKSNAKSIVDTWRVGAELAREARDGSFTEKGVEEAIKAVAGSPAMRERVSELGRIARAAVAEGGSSRTNLSKFVQQLHHHR